ncbi:Lipocalin-like domain-containing protein [Xylariaceae sp. FL0662B]|nr:Lipocalin-like domain-containing protein [Xylariaceae sp. FL0662B]
MVSTRTLQFFTGSFALLNITSTLNGTRVLDSTGGRNPAGTLVYSVDGYMSVLIHATEPEWRPANLTMLDQGPELDWQWALVGKHTGAYSGPFSFNESHGVNDTHGQIVHGPLETATLPANIGRLQFRNFSFTSDGVYLNLVGELGPGLIDNLWWQRKTRDVVFEKERS